MFEDTGNELPDEGRALLRELGDELRRLDARVKRFDAQIAARESACRRLSAIPGIGVLTATALVAAVGEAGKFWNGREMAAWLGLVPRQHSTGGRPTLLGVSKRGDRYLCTLLVHGARAALVAAGSRTDRRSRWALDVRERRGWNFSAHVRLLWPLTPRRGGARQQERAGGLGGAGSRRAVRRGARRRGRVRMNERRGARD